MQQPELLRLLQEFHSLTTTQERHAFASQHGTTVPRLWTLWLKFGRQVEH